MWPWYIVSAAKGEGIMVSGVIFGILLPLVGIWVTTSALSAATQSDDDTQS